MKEFDEEMDAVFVPKTKYVFAGAKGICQFNEVVDCAEKDNCDKCGWNPTILAMRKKETRRKFYRQQIDGAATPNVRTKAEQGDMDLAEIARQIISETRLG